MECKKQDVKQSAQYLLAISLKPELGTIIRVCHHNCYTTHSFALKVSSAKITTHRLLGIDDIEALQEKLFSNTTR